MTSKTEQQIKQAGEQIIINFIEKDIARLKKKNWKFVDVEWAIFNESKIEEIIEIGFDLENKDYKVKSKEYNKIYDECFGDFGCKRQWIKETIEEYLPDESEGYNEEWLDWVKSEF